VTLKLTYDERLADGFYAHRSVEADHDRKARQVGAEFGDVIDRDVVLLAEAVSSAGARRTRWR